MTHVTTLIVIGCKMVQVKFQRDARTLGHSMQYSDLVSNWYEVGLVDTEDPVEGIKRPKVSLAER